MKINEKNLVAFSVAPTVIQREGHLLKRGEVNRAFHRRWFVLKGNLLFYFEKRGDKEPLGVIIMEGCTIELAECEEQVCSFRVIFPGREYLLAADNQELLEAWMKSLARASYSYLKLMVAELEMQLEELNAAERRQAADTDRSPHDSRSGLSAPLVAAHPRLNPFNTAEENRNFAQLWGADGGGDDDTGDATWPADAMRRRSNTVSSGGESRSSTVWHHPPPSGGDNAQHPHGISNTDAHYNISSNNSVKSSRNRSGDIREVSRKHSTRDGKHTSVFFTSEPSVADEMSAPVAPKRLKKASQAGGLKRPPNVTMVQKSNSSASTNSSSSAKSSLSSNSSASATSSSSSSVRQYFPFAQLHMDYGAPILRDRELHRIQFGLCGNRPLAGGDAEEQRLITLDATCQKRRGRLLHESSADELPILITTNRENVPPLLPKKEKQDSSTNLIDFDQYICK